MAERTIAVIGAGASGTLVCAHLLKMGSHPSLRVEWIGNEPTFGPGLAHGTRDPSHLLNVPAGGMSAFADRGDDFPLWLDRHHPELAALRESYVPRMYYGEYLAQLVPQGSPGIQRRSDEAISLENAGGRYRISLKSGQDFEADEVVLALGALSGIEGQSTFGALRPSQIAQIPAGARVLLIGTGLTMVDTILSLSARGDLPTVMAVSPRGLLPRVHGSHDSHGGAPEFRALFDEAIPRLSRAIRVFRAECRSADAAGPGWRAVFDEIRPHTARVWMRLSPRQKSRFNRHLRRYWDIHRHRMAPSVFEKVRDFQNRKILEIDAARVLEIEKNSSGFRVRFQPRSTSATYAETFDALVDCTGFSPQIASIRHALLQSVIRNGLVAVDEPPFGVYQNGWEHPRIHLIGPLLRAHLWESSAIPEIRYQAAEIAEKLLASAKN